MKLSASFVLIAALSLSVACSKKAADSNQKQINELSERTTIIYEQVRSKEAEETRNKKFEILNSKDEKLGTKIAAAAIYFKSLDFQLSNSKSREKLFLDAADEFTKRITDIYEQINLKRMSPTNENKKHSEEQSFYALSITMHLNNHYQKELVDAKASLTAISFYDLVVQALKKDYNLDTLTEYEEVLVTHMNREIMVELIKARVDMFSALALKNLTDKRDMTLSQKLKKELFKRSGGKWGAIELPEVFSKSNGPTKKQTIKYLEAATSAREDLNALGIKKELEETVKSAFSKIKLGDKDQSEDDATEEGESSLTQEEAETKADSDGLKIEIKNLINGLLK